ncbi:MAG: hypothetical protein ACPG4T_00800, partial [Nannocystaceae bacterium]
TFAKLAHAWPAIIRGSHVTRPLVLPRPTPPGRSIARGGNVLILDRNALLAAPFPVHRGEDGVVTRRADTLAAVLVDDTVWQCRVFDLPLLHGRLLADGSSPMSNRKRDGFNLAAFVEAQARGVAMVRATHHGTPKSVDTHLDRRRQLHQTGFDAIRETLKKVRTLLQNPNSWWWSVAYEHHVRDILAGLNELAASIPSTADLDAVSTDISEDLAHFCGALKAKTRQWRRTWV